jgi:hypothetical protein
MKKILLFTAAVLLSGASSFAEGTISGGFTMNSELEAKCTNITRAMANELRLNEPEYIKLKELNRKRMAQTNELLQSYSANDPLLQEKIREMELAYEQEITAFLTPNQLHAYANYKQNTTDIKFVAAIKE